MFKLAQALHKVGYPYQLRAKRLFILQLACYSQSMQRPVGRGRYMLMPDHAPSHPDQKVSGQVGKGSQFAFQFGYIIAIIQAVKLAAMAGAPEVLNDLNSWQTVRTVTDTDSTHVPVTGKGIAKL